MSCKEKSITESFVNSIKNNALDATIETAEIVLDSSIDNEILKEIPILKYAVTAYQLFDDIKGRVFLQKLQQFIISFNAGLTSDDEIRKQRDRFIGNDRDKELTYISIIIDRYLDIKKPVILAKLYLAYLDDFLLWDEFCSYSEIIDKLLFNDLKYLIDNQFFTAKNNVFPAELLRLTAVGLMDNYQNDSPFQGDGAGGIMIPYGSFEQVISKERIFEITSFGQKLVDIVTSY